MENRTRTRLKGSAFSIVEQTKKQRERCDTLLRDYRKDCSDSTSYCDYFYNRILNMCGNIFSKK